MNTMRIAILHIASFLLLLSIDWDSECSMAGPLLIGSVSPREHIRRYYSKFLRSWHDDGVLVTANRLFQFSYHKPFSWFINWRFDRKWGVETAGAVDHPSDSSNPLHLSAVRYEPTSEKIFQKIMNSIGCLTDQFYFYDIGCGKGRVLLMASKYQFKHVIGIEFSSELVNIAGDNIRRFQSNHSPKAKIEIVCADAATYEFPDEESLIFFYNPFDERIMRKVLDNIRRSIHRTKNRYIIYYNPVLESLFSDPERFSLILRERAYSIYRVLV